ncbi:MAG: M3 family peptidase [Deltaproteobacteria bacterium]|nr:MAG: M3 family peptidase [Deltaproteobacteria bacterium]
MTADSNPLLAWGTLPDFDAITADHVGPAMRETLARCEADLTALEARAAELDAFALVGALEPIEDRIGWTWTLANHLNSVRTTDLLRKAIEAVQGEVVAFQSRLAQSRPLYEAFRRLRDGDGFDALPSAVRRVVILNLRGAEHSGVGLVGEARERFNKNQQELARLSLEFGNNVLDATKAWSLDLTTGDEVRGLPKSLLGLAAQNARSAGHEDATADRGPWRVTLDYPSFVPFMEYAERRDLREQVYRAYVTRASAPPFDNGPLIERILELRREQARALGFETFAELSIDAKMAPDVAAVSALLGDLREVSYAAAERELGELGAFAAGHGGPDRLAVWDHAYWARRLRQARFDYSDEELRPYFPLPQVLDGLFALAERLFGVRVTANDAVRGWHEDVRFFDVADDSGAPLAGFYLDAFSRPANKRGGAWMNECVGRSRALADGDGVRLPIAYLVSNQSPPVDGKPSLMTFNEVQTLFHEFGHGLQHMLTQVDEGAVAGINGVEWDAVELPSQFMENWLRHRPALERFARHYETGEPLPAELIDRVLASQTFRAGTAFLRQLYFADLDLAIHHRYEPGGALTLAQVQADVVARNTVVPPLPEDRFICSFGHLFSGGYAAGYYSYKWAEVLSADAFSAFEEAGLDDEDAVREVGHRFRDTILALGGSLDPMSVFVRFRGRKPDTAPLLRHNGLVAA